jgi:hypothetical protein
MEFMPIKPSRLLLDSRVVDLPMVYNSTSLLLDSRVVEFEDVVY